jgi:hypothetical protein
VTRSPKSEWLQRARRLGRPSDAIPFEPSVLRPVPTIDVESAWKGHELVIGDVLDRFDVGRTRCLEFGVEFGYSTVVFSSYFTSVTGVDLFTGDIHTVHHGDSFP